MKMKALCGCVAAVGLSFAFAGTAFGQACTANGATITAPTPAGTPISGNNCPAGVANNSNQTKICGNGETLNGAGIDIYTITLGASQNFTFSVNSAAFSPEIALTSVSTCSSNANCKVDVSPLGTDTSPFTVNSGTVTGLAAGNYFLFVGDVGGDSPGCGAYTLTVNATLPVELKSFSID